MLHSDPFSFSIPDTSNHRRPINLNLRLIEWSQFFDRGQERTVPFEKPRRWRVDVVLVEVVLVEVALVEVALVEVALIGVVVHVQVVLPLPSMRHRRRRQTRWYQ